MQYASVPPVTQQLAPIGRRRYDGCHGLRVRPVVASVARFGFVVFCVCAGMTACNGDAFTARQDDQRVVREHLALDVSVTGESAADGASVLLLTAKLSGGAVPSGAVATFSSSVGTFLPTNASTASVAFGPDATVAMQLRAPATPSDAIVRTTVRDLLQVRTVSFTAALPDTLLLQPRDSFTVRAEPAGGQIFLTATLLRRVGSVSAGAMITFTDSLPTGRAGAFRAATRSDASGRAEVPYTPGLTDTTNRGPRRIFACANGVNRIVCGSTTVFVQ
jgi:hypothetical protein